MKSKLNQPIGNASVPSPPRDKSYLQACRVSFSYSPQAAPIISELDLDIKKGELIALLGPNGAGKSTLLRLLAGITRPQSGRVTLQGQSLSTLSSKEKALQLAYVPQNVQMTFPFTCREAVAMGRYAHNSFYRLLSFQDTQAKQEQAIVERCLRETGLSDLSERPVTELSGGEAQRVRIAQALTQEANILLLDEPTAHLDVSFQMELMELTYRLNRQNNLTVVTAIHDLNLAAMYCDRIVVLQAGHVAASGPPELVLTEELIASVFKVQVRREKLPSGRLHLVFIPSIPELAT